MYCKYCGKDKDIKEFEIASVVKGKTYLRKKCKKCKQKSQNDRKQKAKDFLIQYKKSLVCSICGYNDYRAIVFHHRDKKEKEFNVSDMIRRGFSVENIKKEISKCDPLCSNCHLILHFEERIG